jgi:hypothetical protein
MGKRSLPDQRRFWGSVLCAVVTWAGLVSLPVLGVWGFWRLAHTPENPPSPAVVSRPPAVVSRPAPSRFPLDSPAPSASEPLPPAAPPSGGGAPEAPGATLASIRLQVLNGSGARSPAARAVQVLRDAGCRVVAMLPARERYRATVILYQPGNDTLAGEVARLLGAGHLRPAPAGLDRNIEVTVVVGADYAG